MKIKNNQIPDELKNEVIKFLIKYHFILDDVGEELTTGKKEIILKGKVIDKFNTIMDIRHVRKIFSIYEHSYKYHINQYLALYMIFFNIHNAILIHNNFNHFLKATVSETNNQKALVFNSEEDRNIAMRAFANTTIDSIFLNYSKLIEIIEKNDNDNNRDIHLNLKKLISKDMDLNNAYLELKKLNDLIQKTDILLLRDQFIAHPYKDDKDWKILTPSQLTDKRLNSLRVLASLNSKDINPLENYINKYLYNSEMKMQKHILIIFNFMKKYQSAFLFGVDIVMRSNQEIFIELDNDFYKINNMIKGINLDN